MSSKNMLRKSILIGLFVLKNNRTIGEPRSFQSRKGNHPNTLFSGGYRWHRELEGFFVQTVTGGKGVTGIRMFYKT